MFSNLTARGGLSPTATLQCSKILGDYTQYSRDIYLCRIARSVGQSYGPPPSPPATAGKQHHDRCATEALAFYTV